MSTISSFKSIENDYYACRGKDCMKKFCKSLREDTMKINNFEKKKMKSLTNEQQESNQKTKIYSICKENVENKYLKQKYCKVGDHCHYTEKYTGAVHSICSLKHSIPKKNSCSF